MKSLLTTTAAALFVAGAAFAQEGELEWDVDNDNMISQDEFAGSEEFGAGFGEWDTDDDSFISEDEWNEAEVETDVEFSEWDEDGDAQLSEDEFGGGVFTSYDEDEDSFWNEDEYGVYQDDEGWF